MLLLRFGAIIKFWDKIYTPEYNSLNPTLHGLKNVAGYTGGGHYGHPLENYPGGHFCGQIDL